MIGDVRKVRGILDGHDPAQSMGDAVIADRTAVLAHILDTAGDTGRGGRRHGDGVRRRSRALWLVPVGVAAVLVAIVVTQLGLPGGGAPSLAQAATPPPLTYQAEPGTARDALLAVASRVRVTDTPARSAGYQYVRTQSWDLSTRIDGRQVRSAVVPEIREVWRASEGSGRIRTTSGTPQFPSEQARQDWEKEGRPTADPADETFPAGALDAMYPTNLPTSTAELAALLATGHPASNGPAETLVAIADLYREQTPPAPVRAALLDILATTPGLHLQGHTVDRAGRPALAVAVDSAMSGLPTRYALLINPTDGRLLGQEQTLTTTAGALDVSIPAVISYTSYLTAAHTDDTEPPR
ncbi:CU044_5270 family protein [Frankia sp. AgB32]|uniref:CU044_5270 family protein n=1 Tax=Frankia sp. AgB32 TaxID=631119 RepID=UPI00200C4671|nr:CU044_5270 family protein [Frankia sp. AgB32]MCK9894019.1 CU044_5270 family protein [Frankia sp. AgB32]